MSVLKASTVYMYHLSIISCVLLMFCFRGGSRQLRWLGAQWPKYPNIDVIKTERQTCLTIPNALRLNGTLSVSPCSPHGWQKGRYPCVRSFQTWLNIARQDLPPMLRRSCRDFRVRHGLSIIHNLHPNLKFFWLAGGEPSRGSTWIKRCTYNVGEGGI